VSVIADNELKYTAHDWRCNPCYVLISQKRGSVRRSTVSAKGWKLPTAEKFLEEEDRKAEKD